MEKTTNEQDNLFIQRHMRNKIDATVQDFEQFNSGNINALTGERDEPSLQSYIEDNWEDIFPDDFRDCLDDEKTFQGAFIDACDTVQSSMYTPADEDAKYIYE